MRYFVVLAILCGVEALGINTIGSALLKQQEINLSSQLQVSLVKNCAITQRCQVSQIPPTADTSLPAVGRREKLDSTINQKQEIISLLFVGDIMLSRGVAHQIEKNNNILFSFQKSVQTTQAADITFGNLENPISARGKNQGSQYSFRADPSVVVGLSFAGFDVLSVANNHMWDWGKDALLDTQKLLTEKNIQAIGAGENEKQAGEAAIINIKGRSIAFLACTNLYPRGLWATENTPGVNACQQKEFIESITEAKKKNDIVVASLHWGTEYAPHPDVWQKEFAHTLIEAGADIVAGHHPHVVQDAQIYKTKDGLREGIIFYSLGNFIFDQNFSKETTTAGIGKIVIEGSNTINAQLCFAPINVFFQPVLDASAPSCQKVEYMVQ